MIINQDNFDWSVTERELVLFIPNFKRKHLILPTLDRLQTSLPKDQWVVLILNDGSHEDLSDLAKYNVVFFTLEHNHKERNGCMARNYVIQRVKSRLLMSKDPEVILHSDDCFAEVIQIKNQVYRAGRALELMELDAQKIIKNPDLDVSQLPIRREYRVHAGCYEGFHFNYTAPVELLRKIGGYDERFVQSYGWEDVELFERLQMHTDVQRELKTTAMHIWHPRHAKFLKSVRDNAQIYSEMKGQGIANAGHAWGNG